MCTILWHQHDEFRWRCLSSATLIFKGPPGKNYRYLTAVITAIFGNGIDTVSYGNFRYHFNRCRKIIFSRSRFRWNISSRSSRNGYYANHRITVIFRQLCNRCQKKQNISTVTVLEVLTAIWYTLHMCSRLINISYSTDVQFLGWVLSLLCLFCHFLFKFLYLQVPLFSIL